MSKEYKEINFSLIGTLEDSVNELLEYKEKGVLTCGNFNGTMLYSDTVTMDGAYKNITGKTKKEFDDLQKKNKEWYEKQQREHQKRIPELTKFWEDRGRKVLSKDRWQKWDDIVPIRLGDLYQGMELGSCLEIVEILNQGCTLEKAKSEIYNQDHSGMSFSLVCAMVEEFCDRGKEFADYVNQD